MGEVARQVLTVSARERACFRSILFAQTDGFAFSSPAGRLVTDQLVLGDSGMRVSRVRSTGHWIRLTEHRDASFLFARAGSLTVRIAAADTRVPAGEAVLVRPASRLTRVEGTGRHGFEGHVLMMPMVDLCALADRVPARPVVARDLVPLSGAAARRLSGYVAHLVTAAPDWLDHRPSARTLDGMAALMRDMLLDWLTDAAQGDTAVPRALVSTDAARARRADEIMRTRFDEPLSIGGLAEELGTSMRSLQLAFRAVFGEGPRSRLTRIRLDMARERLRLADHDQQVTRIALDCGFTHLGRFADVYRRTYGERPSDTLARQQDSCSDRHNPQTAAHG